MSRPAPDLLEQLATSRYLTGAAASVGSGERRSAMLGSGLEFEAHRSYRDGDDTRHIDPRLLARLDEDHIRLYAVERQMPITIVLDASASMGHGTPDKFATATALAQLFAFVGLAGGDRVQMALCGDGKLHWSPKFSGVSRAELAFDWLDGQVARGTAPFGESLRLLRASLPKQSQLILISDWWDEEAPKAIEAMGLAGHDLLAVHIQAPEEVDPAGLGQGSLRLTDVESDEEIDLTVDAGTINAYRALLSEWRDSLRQACLRWQGRYFHVSSALSVDSFFLRDLRGAGVIS